MTTTGSSVLTDIPALPRSLLMWRQFSQWFGGMGSSSSHSPSFPGCASAAGS